MEERARWKKFKCYLIICLISIFKSQIVIFGFQIDKWVDQFILDHLPENSGHLVSIHLDQMEDFV